MPFSDWWSARDVAADPRTDTATRRIERRFLFAFAVLMFVVVIVLPVLVLAL